MKSLGGYLQVENKSSIKNLYNKSTIYSNARTCIYLIVKELEIKVMHIPYYICSEVIDVLNKLNVVIKYYHLNNEFLPKNINLNVNEYILYINYFGICDSNIKYLSKIYNEYLIIDNTMSFYSNNEHNICFNSARKFLGIPDGAFLNGCLIKTKIHEHSNAIDDHLHLRKENKLKEGYKFFLKNEEILNNICLLANPKSIKILDNINHDRIRLIRRRNYKFLCEALDNLNLINTQICTDSTPLCYPFLTQNKINFKHLHRKNIFVPRYWPNLIKETKFTSNLFFSDILPLPIDQNITYDDLEYLLRNLKQLLK